MGYDTATTTETQLWVDNNEPLQRRKMFMWANLARKMRRGVFNPKLAEKLFRYLCDDAARSYRKEIGEPLPMDDRRQAEKDLVQEFLNRVKDAERSPGDLPADVLAELRKPSTAKPGAVGMRSPLRPSPPTSSTPAFYVESNDAPDAAWRRESFLDFDTARRYALENARKHPAESSVQFLVNDRNTGRTLLVFGGGGQVVASELVSGRKHAAPEATEPVVARRK